MKWSAAVSINIIILGMGLAADDFFVLAADRLYKPKMNKSEIVKAAVIFSAVQSLVLILGWKFIHITAEYIKFSEHLIYLAAFVLLMSAGISIIFNGIHICSGKRTNNSGFAALFIQSAAVSADAFFAGLSIGDYSFTTVLAASLIAAVITLTVCIIGFTANEDLGRKLSDTAQLLSGAFYIILGLKIFVSNIIWECGVL